MRTDPTTLAIFQAHFRAAAETMGFALERAAHTTFVKASSDFCTGLITPRGEHFGYPVRIGVWGYVGLPFRVALEAIPDWADGDIAIANDPWRTGAMATRLRFQVFEPEAIVTARGMERLKFQPWGVEGGRCGRSGGATLNPGTPQAQEIGKIDVLRLEPGDVVEVRSVGGAGYGDACARPVEAVLTDVRGGLVSEAAARASYGVVVIDGEVDAEGTQRTREALRGGVLTDLDLGEFRRAYETRWPQVLRARLVEHLMALPIPLRNRLKRRMHEEMAASHSQPTTVEAFDALWERVRSRIGGA